MNSKDLEDDLDYESLKTIISHMGDSPKWVKSRRRRKKKKERERERGAKVGENNGQATHGARKHAWRTQAAWANFNV